MKRYCTSEKYQSEMGVSTATPFQTLFNVLVSILAIAFVYSIYHNRSLVQVMYVAELTDIYFFTTEGFL